MDPIDIGDRSKIVSIRFSQSELELLAHRAEVIGTPLSSYIRTMASIPVKFADAYGSACAGDALPAMVVYQNELSDARKSVMLTYLNMSTVARELNAIRKGDADIADLADVLERHARSMGELIDLYDVLVDLLGQAITSMRAIRSNVEIVPLPKPQEAADAPAQATV